MGERKYQMEEKNTGVMEDASSVKDVSTSNTATDATATASKNTTTDLTTEHKGESTAPISEAEKTEDNAKITFTKEQQDEINRITSKRVNEVKEKAVNDLLTKYGFKEIKELESALGKNQDYDTLKNTYSTEHTELITLREENALIKNSIDPASYDIVKNYFKGANADLNSDNLAKMLKDNANVSKQWVKHNEITNLGIQSNQKTEADNYQTWKKQVGVNY